MSLKSLASIENWPVSTAAAGVVRADGTIVGTHGPAGQRFPLASVTKPLAAYAVLVAFEEGAIELDERLVSGRRGNLTVPRLARALTEDGAASIGWSPPGPR